MAARALLASVVSLVVLLALPLVLHAQDGSARLETLRQVAGILDYIGGDYRGAVAPDGTVLSGPEYAEQRSLASDAIALLGKVGIGRSDPLQQRLAELTTALDARKPPVEIEALCRSARETLLKNHRVDLTPAAIPSRNLAEQLYKAKACNTCHGDDGSANTPTAAALDPQPANFLDEERVSTVSPHRAYHALTFGVPGTAMTAYSALNDNERWSLAFYVLSLRHAKADVARGKDALDAIKPAIPSGPRELSSLTEEELTKKLAVIADPAARRDALAYLRAGAPFAQNAGGSMTLAYQRMQTGLEAYRRGERESARRAFISAYLDGVEPHEAGLRTRDPELVQQIETAMLALRSAAAEGAPVPQLEAAIDRVRGLLDRAQASRGDANTALIGAMTIALREGVEIVLLVAALLGLVRKRGQPQLARWVHAGWMLSIPAGLATFYLAESALDGMSRELAEGVASILAALVLVGVTHWLLGQLGSKHWVGFLAKRMSEAMTGQRAGAAVLALSFIAAYREAFEIVLFYEALAHDAGNVQQVWLGAGIGLALLAVFALIMKRVGQRLRPGPFMLASSICLAVLCFVLLGKGVHSLQEAAVVPLHTLPWPYLPSLGIYPSIESLTAQGVVALALAASAIVPWLNERRASGNSASEAAE